MTAEEFHARRLTLIEYLHVKVAMCDWHGAADACCDLREMEAEQRGRLRAPQPTSIKYQPIIDQLNAQSSR